MKNKTKSTIITALLLIIAAVTIAGCGGGGGAPAATPAVTGTMDGYILGELGTPGAGRVQASSAEAVATAVDQPSDATGTQALEGPSAPRQLGAATPSIYVPVVGATVTCSGKSTTTDSTGRYTFTGFTFAADGTAACTVSKTGYQGSTFTGRRLTETSPAPVVTEGIFLTPAATGTVVITSNVDGATIVFDGATVVGLTAPVSIVVPAGDHTLSITKTGYEAPTTQNLTVAASAQGTADFTNAAALILSVTGINISIATPGSDSVLDIGEVVQLAATCTYSDGSSKDCTSDVTWGTDNACVTVTAGGQVTAVSACTPNISAKRDQSGITNTPFTLSVSVYITSISVSITTPGSDVALDIGEVVQLAATCAYSDNTSRDCSSEVLWSSDDNTCITLTSGAQITANSACSINITAKRYETGLTNTPFAMTVSPYLLENTCSGISGLCLDAIGVYTAYPGGSASVAVMVNAPPAAGLGAGRLYISWDASKASLSSVTPASGISVISEEINNTAGTYKAVFTSSSAVTSQSSIMNLNFTISSSAVVGQVTVTIVSSNDIFDLSDFTRSLLNLASLTVKTGYINIH